MVRIIQKPRTLGVLIAVAVLVGGIGAAQAALTTGSCLAQKQKTWGGLRKCQAGERAKLLQGKTADLAKCQTKFDDKIAKISAKAADASVACRFADNGDGTVTDYDTGLQWEQKTTAWGSGTNYADPHDVDNTYNWSPAGTAADGTVFKDFLDKLNNCASSDGSTVTGGFAGHCDWRLPSVVELDGIVDLAAGPPKIDPVFGPTASSYWSATTLVSDPSGAWFVLFDSGDVPFAFKGSVLSGRAVRPDL